MSYNPNFPPDHVALTAAPWRDQFNALKALIDAQATTIAAQQTTIQSQAAQISAQQAAFDNLQSQFNDLSLFAGDTNQSLIALQGAFNDYVAAHS